MRIPLLLIAFFAFVLIGCTSPTNIAHDPPAAAEKAQVPLPRHVASRLEPAMKLLTPDVPVESYRVEPKPVSDRTKGVLGYPIIADGPRLDAATRLQLSSLILDARGYGGGNWCGFDPGIAFRFVGQSQVLTVLICFKCQTWEFWLNDERLGSDSFEGIQPELLGLVQKVLPADAALQSIKPSEIYGRIYHIRASVGQDRNDEAVQKFISSWAERIMGAVKDPGGWIDHGGDRYRLRFTDDPTFVIAITNAEGHAAIGALDRIETVKQ